MKILTSSVRVALGAFLSLLVGVVALLATTGVASATPTAEFTYSPTAPAVREPVTFRFRGTCDIAPCSVGWRWFKTGGSSLGTTMGSGDVLSYAFSSPGTYSVVAKITNSGSTHGFATATHVLIVTDTFQDDDRRVGYGGWWGASNTGASAGGYRYSSKTWAAATHTFSGTSVTYTARTGPNRGIAAVSVDGVAGPAVDLYSPVSGSHSTTVAGLAAGTHRIRVAPTGTKNTASTASIVTVDDFVVDTGRADDTAPSVEYTGWVNEASVEADGGTMRSTATTGADAAFIFHGPSVTWLSSAGPDQGHAGVYIDNVRVGLVDGYATTKTWKVPHTFDGLTAGPHTLRLVALGTRHPSSTGNRVTIDALIVR